MSVHKQVAADLDEVANEVQRALDYISIGYVRDGKDGKLWLNENSDKEDLFENLEETRDALLNIKHLPNKVDLTELDRFEKLVGALREDTYEYVGE